MASANPTTMDTLVTIKVNYQNATRKTKIPLRDTVPQVLESKMRAFLQIPSDIQINIERFSDSAASYILLDENNASVYKQLYRAAKSKLKLKFRVTHKDDEECSSTLESQAASEALDTTGASASSSSPSDAPVVEEATFACPEAASSVVTGDKLKSSSPAEQPNLPKLSPSQQAQDDRLDALCVLKAKRTRERLQATSRELASHSKALEKIKEPEADTSCPAAEMLQSYVKTPQSTGDRYARFAICCNSCEKATPDFHYHCGTCDDGDFDLCQSCVDSGATCHGFDHWLFKRTTRNGRIVHSLTETIPPKAMVENDDDDDDHMPSLSGPNPDESNESRSRRTFADLASMCEGMGRLRLDVRTCNSCVTEHPEAEFLHCQVCEDFDLCQPCFAGNAHGHHPAHGFEPAVLGTQMPAHITAKLAPGRNQSHFAICDNCDKYITGVRHKCLDCPDWDYCSDCIPLANSKHPRHRFVPLYQPLASPNTQCMMSNPVHAGICCDGPLCSKAEFAYPSYIRGVRYKCAVCDDVDYCASCEACPDNKHNKTHPMIKFKTPVRHASVTTHGEHANGQKMPPMGDRNAVTAPSMNAVQTVVDLKPQEPAPVVSTNHVEKVPSIKLSHVEKENISKSPINEQLCAVFVQEHVSDGTIMAPNQVFEQTWVLRNEGKVSWPAGCSVKYVGGDYMGHVDSSHPAGISELISTSESTVCYEPLAPGREFSFTVLLRTPARPGRIVSYWRLTTNDGFKFGHRLWCEVNVREFKVSQTLKPETGVVEPEKKQEEEPTAATQVDSSQMIFPTLEKESPVASMHEEASVSQHAAASDDNISDIDRVPSCGDEEWDESVDGFMTDEEYDILDASDEEYVEDQQKQQSRK